MEAMAKRELQIAPAKRTSFLSLLYFVVLLFPSLKESEAAQAIGEKVDQTKQNKKTDKCLMLHCWSAEIQRRCELVKK